MTLDVAAVAEATATTPTWQWSQLDDARKTLLAAQAILEPKPGIKPHPPGFDIHRETLVQMRSAAELIRQAVGVEGPQDALHAVDHVLEHVDHSIALLTTQDPSHGVTPTLLVADRVRSALTLLEYAQGVIQNQTYGFG